MPGRLILTHDGAALSAALGVTVEASPRDNIAPGEEILALLPDGPARARWGIVPVGRVNARGRPVMERIVNARSETVFDKSAYAGTGRAVIPVSGWYEWTGKTRTKEVWRITRADGAPLLFAAISDVWQAPGGASLLQVAPVTCKPNPEVAEVHDRMAVVLRPEDVAVWLTGDRAAVTPLMAPAPAGTFRVEPVADPGR
ncbi:SOS response-associated peptidase [Pseudoroseicyclus sp. CXY001]|uniref:SOS response-associated peptidase n=1 Tax=Pseudoroseicyclus sp. CXY001 TaxID=3242492 RepID=UPI003571108C